MFEIRSNLTTIVMRTTEASPFDFRKYLIRTYILNANKCFMIDRTFLSSVCYSKIMYLLQYYLIPDIALVRVQAQLCFL